MPRFHFGVILLAEVRTGVGKRLEGGDPVGTIAGVASCGEKWSTLAWRDT